MATSTVTSKGQTTIPLPIRDFLKIGAGDRLEYFPQADGKVVLVPATVDVRELEGILPKPKKPVTLEAMEKAIRKRAGK